MVSCLDRGLYGFVDDLPADSNEESPISGHCQWVGTETSSVVQMPQQDHLWVHFVWRLWALLPEQDIYSGAGVEHTIFPQWQDSRKHSPVHCLAAVAAAAAVNHCLVPGANAPESFPYIVDCLPVPAIVRKGMLHSVHGLSN